MRTTAIGLSLLFLAGAAQSHGDPLDARVVILPPNFTALGISPDGSAVFGRALLEQDPFVVGAAIWRRGRIIPLERGPLESRQSFTIASSLRARVVVDIAHPDVVVWQRGRLRVLAPGGEARAVSWNGRVVAGYVLDPLRLHYVGMRWIDGVPLPIVADGLESFRPLAVSADARTILGDGNLAGGALTRLLWRQGEVVEIDGLPYATDNAIGLIPINGTNQLLLSSDATTIAHRDLVGDPDCQSSCGRTSEAFRWRDGNVEPLGFLRPQDGDSVPVGMTGNGEVIVGATSGEAVTLRAFLWDRVHGMRSLEALLETLGADLQGFELATACGISDDGRRIAGFARDAAEPRLNRGFLAILPPACADRIDNDGDGYVDFPEDRGCRSRHGRSEERRMRPRIRRPRRDSR